MRIYRSSLLALAVAVASVSAAPAAAEVIAAEEGHFITRNEAVVSANRTETWLALISPAGWWASEHTWSADAANLRLTPQAGGCFCERIPEVDEPGRFTLAGSAEHMRVIQAYPETALRMSGGLGPLQSEPVTGILTIALSEVELDNGTMGTRIVWEYNVAGKMRYPLPVIARAVDGVMTLQLARLADTLGTVVAPREPAPPPAPEPEPAPEPAPQEDAGSQEAITIDTEAVIEEGEGGETAPAQGSEEGGPTAVDEAFGDLSG